MINPNISQDAFPTAKISKILVVEDEPTLSMVVCEFLRMMNFEVTCVANGVEALDMMCIKKFDLVISDIMMPKMGGIELIRNIRKVKSTLPIIAVTGSDLDSVLEIQDEFTKGIRKPYAFDTLLSRIYQFEIVYTD
jgi:CheY-like chemotaxis protein